MQMPKERFRWDGKKNIWKGALRYNRSRFIGICSQCNKEQSIAFCSMHCRDCSRNLHFASLKIRTPAIVAVKKAIESGSLPRLDGTIACTDCGRPAEHYDHRDYSQPLSVDAVCSSCNRKRGMAPQTRELRRGPLMWLAA